MAALSSRLIGFLPTNSPGSPFDDKMVHMKTVFVIGGIGSGKSLVSRFFAEEGFPVLDLDMVGHDALKNSSVKKSLVEVFGDGILDGRRDIVRKILAQEAFVSPVATETLTTITAPHILQTMRTWLKARSAEGHPFAIVEVSAFDGPDGFYAGEASLIVAVVAPEELRVQRAIERGFEAADVRRRVARQASDDERRYWAHYVIENDADLEALQSKVKSLSDEIKALP